jgi:hypothetical protein
MAHTGPFGKWVVLSMMGNPFPKLSCFPGFLALKKTKIRKARRA